LTLPAPHGLLRLFSSSLSLRDFHKDPALPLASIIPIMTAFFSAPRYDLSAKAYYVPNTIESPYFSISIYPTYLSRFRSNTEKAGCQ
ncbi:MAG: hypothetical protein WC347_12145, partial [Smithellaceae bacterium]